MKSGEGERIASSSRSWPRDMDLQFDGVMSAPFGCIGVSVTNQVISRIEFLAPDYPVMDPTNALAKAALKQIRRYLNDANSIISLPIDNQGSVFQRKVWKSLSRIACGQTITYGELAVQIKTSARAIGGACRVNPVPLLVPCHRVVSASGLGGFAGGSSGMRTETKKWLLKHESNSLKL